MTKLQIKQITLKIDGDLNHKNITQQRKMNKIFLQFKIGQNKLNTQKINVNNKQIIQKMNKILQIYIKQYQTILILTLYKNVNQNTNTKIISQKKFNLEQMKNYKNNKVTLSIKDEQQSNKTLAKINFQFQFIQITPPIKLQSIAPKIYQLHFQTLQQYQQNTQNNNNPDRKLDFTFNISQMSFILHQDFHKFNISSLSLAFIKGNRIYKTKFVQYYQNSKGQQQVKWQEIQPINFYQNDHDDFYMQILTKQNNNEIKSIAKAKMNIQDLQKQNFSKFSIKQKDTNTKYGNLIIKTETKIQIQKQQITIFKRQIFTKQFQFESYQINQFQQQKYIKLFQQLKPIKQIQIPLPILKYQCYQFNQ